MRDKARELRSLPADRLAHVTGLLSGSTSAAEVAKLIQSWGYFPHDKLESLERKVRRYRQSEITLSQAARIKAVADSPNPRVQRRLISKAEKYSIEANWFRLLQAQEKRVGKWLTSGAGSLPSTAILNDIKLLTEMYAKFTDAMMERGILPRAAKTLNLRAEQIVIDEENLALVCQALQTYLHQHPTIDFGDIVRGTLKTAQLRAVKLEMGRALAEASELPALEYRPVGQSE